MLAVAVALPVFCSAQQNKIIVQPPQPLVVKRSAGTATETLRVVVQPGFHVNSDKPKDEFIIPLKLSWVAGPLDAQSVEYPKPEEIKVGGQDLLVFTGTFPIKTSFRVAGSAQPGSTTLLGKIRYQACSSDMCFRPSTVDVKLPVVIE